MPLAAGQTFADYTIVRLLGSGGMGDVYLADHPRLPRQDALKVLRNDVCADNEYRQRFDREADLAATLWHPHIVGVHDRGDVDGQIWISMDYVDGTDAADVLRKHYPKGMPKDEVLAIITGVAEALDYAHQRGLLHRDVKPANIMITDPAEGEQRVLLGDFGIARRVDDSSNLTATNMTVGTVFYAAPEQLMGEDLDGRADQYALAATAYHLLTGAPPFHHSNPTVVISQHLTASPPALSEKRPELSALDPVLQKALSKDPKDRFNSCLDFARALGHRLGLEPDADNDRTATSVPIATRSGAGRHEAHHARQAPKNRYLRPAFLVPAVLAVLLVVAIALVLIQFHEIEKLLNNDYTPPPTTPATAPRATAPAPPAAPPSEATPTATATAAPSPPVVGADCSPLGASATTANGNTVYCSTLQGTDAEIWSTSQGEVAAPTITVTTQATDEPLPSQEESPVRVCMQETGKTRRECREAIRAANEAGN
jgi:serine/threonine protein kinase, bacterial